MTFTLTGRRLDTAGNPIVNAVQVIRPTVPILQDIGGTWCEVSPSLLTGITDSSGDFSIPDIPPPSQCDPASVQWVFTDDEGSSWSGVIPEAGVMTTGGLHDLGWARLASPLTQAMAQGERGLQGPVGATGLATADATTLVPGALLLDHVASRPHPVALTEDGVAIAPGMIGPLATQVVAGNDPKLTNARTPTAHEATHLPGGTDALNLTLIFLKDLEANRPPAAASNNGVLFFATDTNVVSQSNGTTWTTLLTGYSGVFSGEISAPDVRVTGIGGSATPMRFVGSTTSGAPGSGTYLAGDVVLDRTGIWWLCTTGGTPGTWTQMAAGPPSGPAGGDLTGTYPGPTIGTKKVTAAKMSSGAAPSGQVPIADGAGGVAYGAVSAGVTSVGLALPGIFSVSGSPVTTTGTLTGTLATQAANLVFAGPGTGAAATPTFRALVVADLPTGIPLANLAQGGATTGQVVQWSGSAWVAAASTSSTLAGDADVSISSPAENDQLFYDTGTNTWRNHKALSPNVDNTVLEGDLLYRHTRTTLTIGFIGDSITANVPAGGAAPPTSTASDLSVGGLTVTANNQGVSGKSSADWLPSNGAGPYAAAKAAILAAGASIAHIMLGTVDSTTSVRTTQAAYKANIAAICADLNAAGLICVLSYSPHVVPGSVGGIVDATSNTLLLQYEAAIDQLVNGTSIRQGDTTAYNYFTSHSSEQYDGIHPNATGAIDQGAFWATVLSPIITASLTRLATGATNTALLSNGPATAPSYRKVGAASMTSDAAAGGMVATADGSGGVSFLPGGGSGTGELLVDDTSSAPPVALENEARTDFLFAG